MAKGRLFVVLERVGCGVVIGLIIGWRLSLVIVWVSLSMKR
jgi:uncharacterized membrane protein (Fun14 family)